MQGYNALMKTAIIDNPYLQLSNGLQRIGCIGVGSALISSAVSQASAAAAKSVMLSPIS